MKQLASCISRVKQPAKLQQYYISEKNVQSYLPYTKGTYGNGTKNDDAERATKYRDRNKKAEEGVKRLNGSSEVDQAKLRQENVSEEKRGIKTKDFISHSSRPIALKLHLKLSLENATESEIEYLKTYGHMKNGISRDVIIPADMTLRALHYVIQKAFG